MITRANKARFDPWAGFAFPGFSTSYRLQRSWFEWPDSFVWFLISSSWKDCSEVGLSSSSWTGFIRCSLSDSVISNDLPDELIIPRIDPVRPPEVIAYSLLHLWRIFFYTSERELEPNPNLSNSWDQIYRKHFHFQLKTGTGTLQDNFVQRKSSKKA